MAFPKECIVMACWVGWYLTHDKDGKHKKMPIDPKNGKAAKSNDPATWADYQMAVDAMTKYGCTGIGFMLSDADDFIVIDIDHCFDPETSTFNDVAKAIIGRQPTYMEFSPSGTGVHLWFHGIKPGKASKNSATGVEMYDTLRYMTVTGNKLEGAPDDIAAALPDTLTWIQDTFIARKKDDSNTEKPANTDRLHTDNDTEEPIDLTEKNKSTIKKTRKAVKKLTDDEVIERAQASKNAEAFTKLWDGDWHEKYGSQSEADMALCLMLAFWTGKNAEQMDRLFRQSGLMRSKWDEQHFEDGTKYGTATIQKAIDETQTVYTSGSSTGIFEIGGKYCCVKNGDVFPITNFTIIPVEMIKSDDETQMTADFVNDKGETYRISCMTSDFSNIQKFRNLLNARTIALSFFGGESDLERLKDYISGYPWITKTGVKAMGVYVHEGRPVFVANEGSIAAKGAAVDTIIQLNKYISIRSGILDAGILTGDQIRELGTHILTYNEPEKTIPIFGWAAGCFTKAYLRLNSVKYPHLFLIGEAGSGKSTTLERVLLPFFFHR